MASRRSILRTLNKNPQHSTRTALNVLCHHPSFSKQSNSSASFIRVVHRSPEVPLSLSGASGAATGQRCEEPNSTSHTPYACIYSLDPTLARMFSAIASYPLSTTPNNHSPPTKRPTVTRHPLSTRSPRRRVVSLIHRFAQVRIFAESGNSSG